MASHLVRALQPHYRKALEELPPKIASAAKSVIGEELTLLSLLATVFLGWLAYSLLKRSFSRRKNLPPSVPGLPVLGNLLQLGEKKPHRTFTKWAEKYGPIYSVRTGQVNNVVISSPELAKEAMVTKYSTISKRQMPTALDILTRQKTMVATGDYGDEYRLMKKIMVTHLLGPAPQRANRPLRESTLNDMLDAVLKEVLSSRDRSAEVNVRDATKKALFPFAMYQVFGRDPESVYVPELSRTVSRWEMYDALVAAPLKMAICIDWRDFFPFFKNLIPNKSVVNAVTKTEDLKTTITRALLEEQRRLLAKKKAPDCYLDLLLTLDEAKQITPAALEQSTWEPVIESSDTTPITIEWLMHELCMNQKAQEKVYQELKAVVGDRLVTEDDIPKLVYLDACIKETLRKYPPVPILPARYIEEDVQLGGYDIPKGWELIVNQYGICNDPKRWTDPEKWDPERVLHDEKLDLGYKDFRILPFGAGKRMCAGVQQAMFIIPLHVASFIQHFSWQPVPEENVGSDEATVFLTTHKLHPLKAIATARPGISKRLSS